MTTATIERLSEVQERVLEFVESVQEPIVTGVKNVIEFVDERLPELPELPYADEIPTTREFLTNQFAFADKMLKQNKKFSLAVVRCRQAPRGPAAPHAQGVGPQGHRHEGQEDHHQGQEDHQGLLTWRETVEATSPRRFGLRPLRSLPLSVRFGQRARPRVSPGERSVTPPLVTPPPSEEGPSPRALFAVFGSPPVAGSLGVRPTPNSWEPPLGMLEPGSVRDGVGDGLADRQRRGGRR